MPSRNRHVLGQALLAVLVATIVTFAHGATVGAAVLSTTPVCVAQAPVAAGSGPAYYLFESNGTVVSCGGVPLYGSRTGLRKSNPVVAGAATAAGGGYWLVTARGDVYAYGNAAPLGSPAHLHLRSPIVAFAPTPDGGGYWLVTSQGNLFHYGDAAFYGSTVRERRGGAVVGLLPTPDGKGYWIVSTKGVVRPFGDAPSVGSLEHRRLAVVSAAATPDGRGLVLLTKDGGVHNLGTSAFFGSLVHQRLPRPLTAIATTPDGAGYLAADASGGVFNFGDAIFNGSLATAPPRRPTKVVGLGEVSLPLTVTTTNTPSAPSSLLPHGTFGFDVSNYQCASAGSSLASPSLPATSPFSVIEVAGWLDSADNSCLGAEAAWATAAAGAAGSHYNLYLFVNSPDQSAAAEGLDANGPAGDCASLQVSARPACLAYNYGYEGARAALSYATAVGVSSSLWWLDVEGTNLSSTEWSNFSAGQFWSSSTALNADTIQGALDALHSSGLTVGIYCSSVQWPTITGSFVPSGSPVPLWIAGVPWTNPPYVESDLDAPAMLDGWCVGTSGYGASNPSDLFAGGVPWLLQETPGSEPSPYGIDPDYAC